MKELKKLMDKLEEYAAKIHKLSDEHSACSTELFQATTRTCDSCGVTARVYPSNDRFKEIEEKRKKLDEEIRLLEKPADTIAEQIEEKLNELFKTDNVTYYVEVDY